MDDKSTFPYCLLDAILFEVAGKSGTQDYNYLLHDLATTFAHVRQMFLSKPHSKFSDMATYIQTHGLHNTAALKHSLPALCQDSFFPYRTPVQSRPGEPLGVNEYIYLPPLGSRQINEFLQKYADDVPSEYQDEIAAVIYYLRVNCWTNRRGTGGYASFLADGTMGVTKYSKDHNAKKRQRTIRAQARELEQQMALIQQRQEEEEEEEKTRLETEKQEQEIESLQVGMRRMSFLDAQVAEMQRIQERANEVRYRSINRYLDQLRLQAATAGTRRNVEMLRQALETLLRRHHHQPQAEVCLFGSFESGLSTLTSDADFTVLNFRDLGREPIRELASNLQDSGWGPIKTIANARVPIVSFTGHGIRCDMSINQPMGVFNSQLINAYQRIDPRFLGMWFGLRTLADKNGILGGSTGYLSSYALTMMLIVFLQDITSPPILPRLQQQSADKMISRTIDGYHCAFDKEPRNYATLAAQNTKSAGQLLTEFCIYFGHTFDYTILEVNPRLGVIRSWSVPAPPRSRRDSRPKDWRMLVLDPFITDRNVAGNCRANHVADIQKCFRDAYEAIVRDDITKAFKV
ncbi:hypothetical protein BGX30_010184 [Mortierella sp. GBA39]|nr:hypothetical protein BGX30_010184 [Mortierella sp. GBA39]